MLLCDCQFNRGCYRPPEPLYIDMERRVMLVVNMDRLKAKIADSGMTIPTLADKAKMKDYTLRRKLEGDGNNFTADEIVGLSKALRLKMSERNEIFLT